MLAVYIEEHAGVAKVDCPSDTCWAGQIFVDADVVAGVVAAAAANNAVVVLGIPVPLKEDFAVE